MIKAVIISGEYIMDMSNGPLILLAARVYMLTSGTEPRRVLAAKSNGWTRITPQKRLMSGLGKKGEQRSSTSMRNKLLISGLRYDGGVMVFLKNRKAAPDPRVVARLAIMAPGIAP
jgi:hypothetical protein